MSRHTVPITMLIFGLCLGVIGGILTAQAFPLETRLKPREKIEVCQMFRGELWRLTTRCPPPVA